MVALFAKDIIRVWELGMGQDMVNRALTILSIAFPERSWEDLAKLSIGQRDAILLSVREQTFGSRLASRTGCPACNETLEFIFDVADILVKPGVENADEAHNITCGEYEILFRLPNSLDLAAAAGCEDIFAARNLMAQRCVLQARQNGTEITAESLPDEVIVEMTAQMGKQDAQAEVQLDLSCPICSHHWQVTFDIVSFFWTEISAQAKRLLSEVHALAKFYGWREADILSMSSVRRQFYLEMIS